MPISLCVSILIFLIFTIKQGISGVPKIKDNYNPATWMLEVTSASMEAELDLDFADIYKGSPLYQYVIRLALNFYI